MTGMINGSSTALFEPASGPESKLNSRNATQTGGFTTKSPATNDIFLICGIGLLEPYKKFISLDLTKINDNLETP